MKGDVKPVHVKRHFYVAGKRSISTDTFIVAVVPVGTRVSKHAEMALLKQFERVGAGKPLFGPKVLEIIKAADLGAALAA